MAGPSPAVHSPPCSSPSSILRHSTSHFLLSLPSLLLLSLLLLSLRSALLAGTLILSSLPQSDPLLHSLLSHLSSPPQTPRFFHLSPPLPLPLSFFSSPPPLPSPNSSLSSPFLFSLPPNPPQSPSKPFSIALHLLHLLSLLSSAHAIATLAFAFCNSAALGVVFYCVTSTILDRPLPPMICTLRRGAGLGFRRILGFAFLKWAIRDAMVQILCVLFFAEVEDQSQLFSLFVKVKLMPFSLTVLGWNEGGEVRGFLLAWEVLDLAASAFLVLAPWIAAVGDVGRAGREVVKEGVFLVSLVSSQCLWVKLLEMGLNGRLGRWLIAAFCGRRFAMWAQAMFEVYFMVVWFVVYLEARRKEFELGGRRFGREELEQCIDGL